MESSTSTLRQFITQTFNDDELNVFCYDYFREVQTNFTIGMSKAQKIQTDNPEAAVPFYDLAIDLDPGNSDLWSERAFLYFFYLKDFHKAVRDFSKAIQLDPSRENRWCLRGRAYFKLQRIDEALSDFDHTITLDSLSNSGYIYRGDCFRAKGNYVQAIIDYSLAIGLTKRVYKDEIAWIALKRGKAYKALNDDPNSGYGVWQFAHDDFEFTIEFGGPKESEEAKVELAKLNQ